ncbi:MAG: flagellar assembly protein T N-terminal domain-containing protein [Elusimicrobiales bacterium]|nr:flagellar assembly protein T N-terminal domain-containing protein [Elusimicrobiales bacterium]
MKKNVIFLALCFIVISCSSGNVKKSKINSSYNVEIVETVGTSSIVDNNIELARKSAISEALKNAIHLVVGVYISANSLVSKSVLIDDEINSNTQGYIESYEILKEYMNNGFYHVKIRAAVRKEEIQVKAFSLENEIEKIGTPVININLANDSEPQFDGPQNTLISEFKKDLFRMSYSTTDADVIVDGRVYTSFNTSEGIGGFISYRCYIDGKIYTSEGEPIGGFSNSGGSIGLNDVDAKKNAAISCAKKIYPIVKEAIILFYSSKRTIKIEILNIKSISELNDVIKFFKNVSIVKNVYVKNFNNDRCIIDVVMHKLKLDDLINIMNKSEIFDIKKVVNFNIIAYKK